MSKNWFPAINQLTCINCHGCLDLCPHGVYAQKDGQVIVTHPEGCIDHCHGCGSRCPTGSISYHGEDTDWVAPALKKSIELKVQRKEKNNMKIQALGGCCKNSAKNYENVVAAVKELGLGIEVEHVTDMNAIMALGVMATPGLVIDGKVYSVGRVLTISQAKEFIQKSQQGSCECGSGCNCKK